ncbi:hypothetical protein [Alteraurantiacibacter aestuarii]|nr:hypothetical protein [Alteraurantiacibacter aestuarii]
MLVKFDAVAMVGADLGLVADAVNLPLNLPVNCGRKALMALP